MNYDQLAGMKVVELRTYMRKIRKQYNEILKSALSSKEISKAPKARLLYMLCRYWAELDSALRLRQLFEQAEQRITLQNNRITQLEKELQDLLSLIDNFYREVHNGH